MTTLFDAPPAADTLAPGIHTIPAEDYHRDPTSDPSLSASIAALMCNRSPRHAWTAHPRLNSAHVPTEQANFDLGTTAHALLLQGLDVATVIDATDWRTKAAKDARDEARANGHIPLLVDQWVRVRDMVAAVRDQLATVDAQPPLLTDGRPEQTLIWTEPNGITCRARLDWLRDDYTAVDDFKSTAASAHPRDWARRLWDQGADVQCAMYRRGVQVLTGTEPEFRFVIAETTPPYALSVVSLDPSALALAEEKLDWAIAKWADCLASGDWPAYPSSVEPIEMSGWAEERWVMAREADGTLECTTTELKL